MELGKDKYRLLMEHLPDAFAYHQIVTDSSGKPVDYIFLEVNPVFYEMTGFPKDKVINKKITELQPEITEADFDWIGTYGQVALTGKSIRFEQYSEMANRWYEITAYSDEPGYFAVFFRDITEQKRLERDLVKSESLHKETQRITRVGGWEYDVLSGITTWTDEVYNIYGVSKEYNHSDISMAMSFYTPQSQQALENAFQRAVDHGESYDLELQFVNAHGEQLWLRTIGNPEQLDGKTFRIVGIIMDITERKQVEEKLLEEHTLRMNLLDNIPNCIALILQKETREIVASNKAAQEIGAVPGEKCYETCASRNDACPFCLAPVLWATGEQIEIEVNYRGTWHHGIWAPLSDELYVHYIFDINERKQAEEHIRHISFHDSLTGLYNRRFLEEEMKRLDIKRQLPISIIMVDVNGLKLVNDTYGHATGDEVLKSAASILKKSCREEDIIARWGGDEFVILLPQTTAKEAEVICRRIKSSCQETYIEKVPVSLAVGYACKENIDKDLTENLREAENYMYKHKLTESRSSKSDVLNALLITLGEKSQETERHIRRMQKVSKQIAKKLDLSATELGRLELFVRLHDIGKINISEDILTKKGSLTKEEWEIIKEHPEIGCRIARATEEFSHVAEDILAHHERWDGSGYPQGLKGENIPLLARITAFADAYEVMSNGRPYKEPMSKEEIKKELKRCAGTQFDPELVDIFLSVLEE